MFYYCTQQSSHTLAAPQVSVTFGPGQQERRGGVKEGAAPLLPLPHRSRSSGAGPGPGPGPGPGERPP